LRRRIVKHVFFANFSSRWHGSGDCHVCALFRVRYGRLPRFPLKTSRDNEIGVGLELLILLGVVVACVAAAWQTFTGKRPWGPFTDPSDGYLMLFLITVGCVKWLIDVVKPYILDENNAPP
jgi:hypothetical protein